MPPSQIPTLSMLYSGFLTSLLPFWHFYQKFEFSIFTMHSMSRGYSHEQERQGFQSQEQHIPAEISNSTDFFFFLKAVT